MDTSNVETEQQATSMCTNNNIATNNIGTLKLYTNDIASSTDPALPSTSPRPTLSPNQNSNHKTRDYQESLANKSGAGDESNACVEQEQEVTNKREEKQQSLVTIDNKHPNYATNHQAHANYQATQYLYDYRYYYPHIYQPYVHDQLYAVAPYQQQYQNVAYQDHRAFVNNHHQVIRHPADQWQSFRHNYLLQQPPVQFPVFYGPQVAPIICSHGYNELQFVNDDTSSASNWRQTQTESVDDSQNGETCCQDSLLNVCGQTATLITANNEINNRCIKVDANHHATIINKINNDNNKDADQQFDSSCKNQVEPRKIVNQDSPRDDATNSQANSSKHDTLVANNNNKDCCCLNSNNVGSTDADVRRPSSASIYIETFEDNNKLSSSSTSSSSSFKKKKNKNIKKKKKTKKKDDAKVADKEYDDDKKKVGSSNLNREQFIQATITSDDKNQRQVANKNEQIHTDDIINSTNRYKVENNSSKMNLLASQDIKTTKDQQNMIAKQKPIPTKSTSNRGNIEAFVEIDQQNDLYMTDPGAYIGTSDLGSSCSSPPPSTTAASSLSSTLSYDNSSPTREKEPPNHKTNISSQILPEIGQQQLENSENKQDNDDSSYQEPSDLLPNCNNSQQNLHFPSNFYIVNNSTNNKHFAETSTPYVSHPQPLPVAFLYTNTTPIAYYNTVPIMAMQQAPLEVPVINNLSNYDYMSQQAQFAATFPKCDDCYTQNHHYKYLMYPFASPMHVPRANYLTNYHQPYIYRARQQNKTKNIKYLNTFHDFSQRQQYNYNYSYFMKTKSFSSKNNNNYYASNEFKISKLGIEELLAMLPIDAEPTRSQQAYGMDKVWQEEFEKLFSTISTSSASPELINEHSASHEEDSKSSLDSNSCVKLDREDCEIKRKDDEKEEEEEEEGKVNNIKQSEEQVDLYEIKWTFAEVESNPRIVRSHQFISNSASYVCQGYIISALQPVNFTAKPLYSQDTCLKQLEPVDTDSNNAKIDEKVPLGAEHPDDFLQHQVPLRPTMRQMPPRGFPAKLRMFIDSAKVRFCCETCGHGWTSMKGRVVFWYELFEITGLIEEAPQLETADAGACKDIGSDTLLSSNNQVNDSKQAATVNLSDATGGQQHDSSIVANNTMQDSATQNELANNNNRKFIGYCAFKLFGQQCESCKIEGTFERPMWYPEEVKKVLNNLYKKVCQLYLGAETPTIDKQRRAGKPKTSHNSLLCQACFDGLCTDWK